MNQEDVERAARAELVNSLYRHAIDLRGLAMSPMLSLPKYALIREDLEQVCGKLMSLQADISYMPLIYDK